MLPKNKHKTPHKFHSKFTNFSIKFKESMSSSEHTGEIASRVFLTTWPLQSIDCETSGIDSSILLDFVTDYAEYVIAIAGSCNGLVCVVFDYHKIVVFNPSTRKLIELPKPSILFEDYCFGYGFGYDSSVDDYKLVRFHNPNNFYVSGEILAEIFSFRNNCWRRLADIDPSNDIHGKGVFLNNAMHWLVTSGTRRKIVTFDLANEKFSESVPLPDTGVDNESMPLPCNLGVLHGCLSISCTFPEYQIWVMKEYGVKASWTKLYTILDDENMPLFEDWMTPVCCTRKGEIVLDADGRELVMYNPQEGRFGKKIEIKGDWDWFETVLYVETLVSPRIGQSKL